MENKPERRRRAVALAALAQRTGGSTLMINAPTMLNNQITGRSALPYTDFAALAILGIEYECVAVRTESPLKSARDVVDRLEEGSLRAERLDRHLAPAILRGTSLMRSR